MGLPCSLSDPPSMYTYTYTHTRVHAQAHSHKPEQNNTGKYTYKAHTSKLLTFTDDAYRRSAEQKSNRDALTVVPVVVSHRALAVPSNFFPSLDALRSLCLPYSPSPPPPRCAETRGSAVFLQSPVFPGLDVAEESPSR